LEASRRGSRRRKRTPARRRDILASRLTGPVLGLLHVVPDFLVIGAARSGTSFLYRNLRRHPALRSAQHKELHFFDSTRYRLGMGWYRRQFPLRTQKLRAYLAGQPFRTGEATPSYLWHPEAADRVARHLPRVQLLALLRHPAERAYSHWAYAKGRGADLPPFDDVVEHELAMGVDASDTGFLARGIYVDQLERWRRHFPDERMLILHSQRLFRDPSPTWEQVLRFLELPLTPLPSPEARNAAAMDESMSVRARERLESFYAPHTKRLFAFLGEDYGW
jgi:lipopolysaccharide transport system ATP-binding protein